MCFIILSSLLGLKGFIIYLVVFVVLFFVFMLLLVLVVNMIIGVDLKFVKFLSDLISVNLFMWGMFWLVSMKLKCVFWYLFNVFWLFCVVVML